MYEFFDHTADLGIRVRAPDLPRLFEESARALFAAIVENPEAIRSVERHEFSIAGDDREDLFFDWLRGLLYRFHVDQLVFGHFEVTLTPDGLSGIAFGEPFDPDRHHPAQEVKAVTYHELKIVPDSSGLMAEFIVDI
jgi:SHS2 domain-containing protein